ncbi:homoserine kinase [Olsenella sp. HMSC062G07]|uniref:homoserine kinase n=1 Tax=Olsenella sp. HMSC062G07 TaxID=1739330 RepID=UPI0008A550A8|nr:homoserine kinase [Olsenella sp. HMSC062G07]OFK23997.1 homoserine kinase [Olsenella sp. HMSC062G07]
MSRPHVAASPEGARRATPVIIEVPATSANVGVGFDCLGMALDLVARFSFETASRTRIDGCPERFRGADNLVWTSFLETCRRLRREPRPLHITINSPIPLSGGLGSSSACVVAGVIAAQELVGDGLDRDQALDIACELEGHPDNVAPAILGGLVSSFVDRGRTHPVRLEVAPNVSFVAIAPPYELRTADAREVMPRQVSLETAVWQVGHCVAAVHALVTGDLELFSAASSDRLHEPYRAPLIPDYEALRRTALAAGASAYLISGSGATMLAVCDGERVARRVADAVLGMVENRVEGLWVRTLSARSAGARVA